jgi:c-di-GMP-related signal transduction protein
MCINKNINFTHISLCIVLNVLLAEKILSYINKIDTFINNKIEK